VQLRWHVYTCIHLNRIHTYMYIHIHRYKHTHIHTAYISTYNIHAYMPMYKGKMWVQLPWQTCTYIHKHTHTHTLSLSLTHTHTRRDRMWVQLRWQMRGERRMLQRLEGNPQKHLVCQWLVGLFCCLGGLFCLCFGVSFDSGHTCAYLDRTHSSERTHSCERTHSFERTHSKQS